ncbi:MAG: response regulator [Pirellulales bacterium]|nr:response regulator [Pirellulales bacterium]
MKDRRSQQQRGPLINSKEIDTHTAENDSNAPERVYTILAMEDDDIVRQSLAAYLTDRGYKVLEAPNGRVGLEIFHEKKPDLILVDLRMPEVDGLEVIGTVAGESPNTPLIVVSGNNAISNAVEALHLGAWDYLLKPIEDMAILLHAVEISLQRARLIEDNRRYQEQLEELVKKRTAELEETNEALAFENAQRKVIQAQREKLIEVLESKNAELERFTYTVSHDLKSPLITMKGFLGILEKDLGEHCTGDIKEHLDRIDRAADRMFLFLGDLLELSRIGSLVNPPTDVSLTELAREVVDQVNAQIEKHKVQVEIADDMPIVHGDRVRLGEVLQNMIENAVKYMGGQTNPKIEIGMRSGGEESVFFVRDNGIGIDPLFQDKIFGLFDKLDPQSEGSGVGLSLVKRILEVHGGRIWVESEGEGKGSTFCFTLAVPAEVSSADLG